MDTPLPINTFFVDTIPTKLTDGFMTECIGEGRIMLNVAGLLTDNGNKVYVQPSVVWGDTEVSRPPNFISGIPEANEKFVYFSWGPSPSVELLARAELSILFVFDTDINRYYKPRNAYVAFPYPTGSTSRYNIWEQNVGNKFIFLPRVPYVTPERLNNFDKNLIFWATKSGFGHFSQNSGNAEALIKWVGDKLRANSDIVFNMVSANAGPVGPDHESEIRKHPFFRHVGELGDRVKLVGRLSFKNLVNTIRQSKVLVGPGIYNHTFCGSPIPAALLGVPTVYYRESPLMPMGTGMMVEDSSCYSAHVNFLERLYTDASFYGEMSQKYFDYAVSMYTPEKFLTLLGGFLNKNL